MFFPKKESTQDLNKIKDAIEADFDEPAPMPEHDDSMSMEFPPPDHDQMAPLFVKVEKYREILIHLQEMKLYISGTKQLFSLMQELEAIRMDAIKTFRASMQRLENSVMQVDSELLRPRGLNMAEFAHGDQEVRHIEESLTSLQRQLMDLKKDLQSLQ